MRVYVIPLTVWTTLVFSSVGEIWSDEVLRPMNLSELPSDCSAELTTRVQGAEVVWVDYAAIRRDFPQIEKLSDSEIHQWLLENFAFIGSEQQKLNSIRNTDIPVNTSARKRAFRPSGWQRSAILEALAPDGQVMGLVDVKGIGHGALSFREVNEQKERMSLVQGNALEVDQLRIKHHSDGLMSLGEALAEVTRQRAVQMLFEMSGMPLQTVESYAVIHIPVQILKDGGKTIPAAFYLRQASLGRQQGMIKSEKNIYIDPHGFCQKTIQGSAVDFGGVMVKHPQLEKNFGVPEDQNPQNSKPWKWGHETADAWVRGDRQVGARHVQEMLAPLEGDYHNSEIAKQSREKMNQIRTYVRDARARGTNIVEIKAQVRKLLWSLPTLKARLWDPDVSVRLSAISELQKREGPEVLALFEKVLTENAHEVQFSAVEALGMRKTIDVMPLLKKAFENESSSIKQAVVHALKGRTDPNTFLLIQKGLKDSDKRVRWLSVEALVGWSDPQVLLLIEKTMSEDWLDFTEAQRKILIQILKNFSVRDIIPILTKLFTSTDSLRRQFVLEALDKRVHAEALGLFLQALNDSDPFIRDYALLALRDYPSPQSMKHIQRAFKSQISSTRSAAVMALKENQSEEAFAILARAMDDNNIFVQKSAVDVLATMNVKKALPIIRRAIEQGDVSLKPHAVSALVAWKEEPEIFDLLKKLIQDQSIDTVTQKILIQILKIRSESEVIELLLQTVSHRGIHSETRAEAVEALSRWRPSSALGVFQSILDAGVAENAFVQRAILHTLADWNDPLALEILKKEVTKSDEVLRSAAAQALSKRQEPEAILLLQKALEDPSSLVRAAAIRALQFNADPKIQAKIYSALIAEPLYADLLFRHLQITEQARHAAPGLVNNCLLNALRSH